MFFDQFLLINCTARQPETKYKKSFQIIEIFSKYCYTIHKFLNAGYQTGRLGNKIKFFFKENVMNLSAPKQVTWIVAVVLGVLGLLGNFVTLPIIGGFAFWLLFLGFAILAVATIMEGL